MRPAFLTLALTVLALALAACGDSSNEPAATPSPPTSEEQAQAAVCAARADIDAQIKGLKELTPATFTRDAVTQSVDAIRKDLSAITSAQADLSSDRRSKVEAANTAFTTSLQQITSELLTSLSASDARTALVTALQQLETAYRSAFTPLDCE